MGGEIPVASESAPKRKLLDQVRDKLRPLHYAKRTKEAYVDWIRRYILFHDRRHPREMGAAEVEAFLAYLAVERNVSASTQNQALAALLFLFRQILERDLPLIHAVRAKTPDQPIPSTLDIHLAPHWRLGGQVRRRLQKPNGQGSQPEPSQKAPFEAGMGFDLIHGAHLDAAHEKWLFGFHHQGTISCR